MKNLKSAGYLIIGATIAVSIVATLGNSAPKNLAVWKRGVVESCTIGTKPGKVNVFLTMEGHYFIEYPEEAEQWAIYIRSNELLFVERQIQIKITGMGGEVSGLPLLLEDPTIEPYGLKPDFRGELKNGKFYFSHKLMSGKIAVVVLKSLYYDEE